MPLWTGIQRSCSSDAVLRSAALGKRIGDGRALLPPGDGAGEGHPGRAPHEGHPSPHWHPPLPARTGSGCAGILHEL